MGSLICWLLSLFRQESAGCKAASIEDRSSEIAGAIPSSRFSIFAAFRSAASADEIVKVASLLATFTISSGISRLQSRIY